MAKKKSVKAGRLTATVSSIPESESDPVRQYLRASRGHSARRNRGTITLPRVSCLEQPANEETKKGRFT